MMQGPYPRWLHYTGCGSVCRTGEGNHKPAQGGGGLTSNPPTGCAQAGTGILFCSWLCPRTIAGTPYMLAWWTNEELKGSPSADGKMKLSQTRPSLASAALPGHFQPHHVVPPCHPVHTRQAPQREDQGSGWAWGSPLSYHQPVTSREADTPCLSFPVSKPAPPTLLPSAFRGWQADV